MQNMFKLGTVALSLFSFIACGATNKPVQYVHVNQPVYEPASVDYSSGFTVDNSSVVPTGGQSYRSTPSTSVSNSNPSGQVVSNKAQPQRCQQLADEYVPGCYRGFGMGKSRNMNIARQKAILIAKTAAAKKVQDVVEESSELYMEENGSMSSDRFWQSIKSKLKVYNISNPITVCSSTRENNGEYEISVCVQVSAEDVIMYLAPEVGQLNSADQERFNNTIINQIPK